MQRIGFKVYKHHLRAMDKKLREYAQKGEESLQQLLKDIGEKGIHQRVFTGIVDVYTGTLSVKQIKQEIAHFLDLHQLTDFQKYQQFIKQHGNIKRKGYYTQYELSDSAVMILRAMENQPGAFVHIHPARYSPHTFRVKVNTMKTALLTRYLALCRNSPHHKNIELINEARSHIDLSPVGENPESIFQALEEFEKL